MQQRQEVQNTDADTRTIQEPINFLTALQQKSAEQGGLEIPHDEAYHFDDQRAQTLNCVAFVQQGKIIPLFDLAGTPIPQTVEAKTYLSALAARIILDGVLDGLEHITQHRQEGVSS